MVRVSDWKDVLEICSKTRDLAWKRIDGVDDGNVTDSALANEVVRRIATDDRYFYGVTVRVIQVAARFYGGDMAFDCWKEAYEAIRHRMPEWQPISSEFFPYELAECNSWSVDEALAFLLLSRVSNPDLECKLTAVAGVKR